MSDRPYRQPPVSSEEISYLVFNPYRHVSHLIATKDKLPEIKADPSYLSRRQFQVFRTCGPEAKPIDPSTINWSRLSAHTFPYRLCRKLLHLVVALRRGRLTSLAVSHARDGGRDLLLAEADASRIRSPSAIARVVVSVSLAGLLLYFLFQQLAHEDSSQLQMVLERGQFSVTSNGEAFLTTDPWETRLRVASKE